MPHLKKKKVFFLSSLCNLYHFDKKGYWHTKEGIPKVHKESRKKPAPYRLFPRTELELWLVRNAGKRHVVTEIQKGVRRRYCPIFKISFKHLKKVKRSKHPLTDCTES